MIKFVYFDVGGVVIIDFTASSKWQELQSTLGLTQAQIPQFQAIWDSRKDRVCIDYDVDDMVPELVQKLHLSLPPNFSLLEEFVRRFERNLSIYPVLEKINQRVRVGLLTDMYPRMFTSIQKRGLLPPHIPWSIILDSSREQYQKPDYELFRIAENRADVYGKEILFIDNRKDIIDAASQFGWNTFWYDSAHYKKASADLLYYLDHIGLG